jgi:hypothetical protein
LSRLAKEAGPAALSSPYWVWNEAVRLLALTSYRAGEGAMPLREALSAQEAWMNQLGGQRAAA